MNLCKCGEPHDGWPGNDGGQLCQMCWEKECSESWWRMAVVIDTYQAARGESKMASWRDRAKPIIGEILRQTAGQPEEVIKKALFDAYPFHERKYTPYAIWLNEIRRQRGFIPTPKICGHKRPAPTAVEGQESLFEKA